MDAFFSIIENDARLFVYVSYQSNMNILAIHLSLGGCINQI